MVKWHNSIITLYLRCRLQDGIDDILSGEKNCLKSLLDLGLKSAINKEVQYSA